MPDLRFSRSGGVAGVAESLSLSDGVVRVRRGPPGQAPVVSFRAPAALLARLARELESAEVERLPLESREIPAPDAFVYTLVVDGHAIRRDDTQVEPRLEPAIRTLTQLTSRMP